MVMGYLMTLGMVRGSEYGKARNRRDYAVTYHKPTGIQLPTHGQTIMVKVGLLIIWVLFTGKIIIIPLRVKKNKYTLRGTRLKSMELRSIR